ncbi:MAG: hypothetical protein K5686_08030 [Lachnospiraceae bacterium]|nr:hypothetical protein [Lachnospiraceae bacterium]
MKDKILAVCTADEAYALRLQEALSEREAFPFSVYIYTKAGMSRPPGKINLYLADETFYDRLDDPDVPRILLRSRENGPRAERYIWKYQSAEDIRKQLLDYYSETAEAGTSAAAGRRSTKVIGIFSPVARSIQTSFSLLMGQFLAKHSKVLYLNLEPFSGLSKLMCDSNNRDLTDLVYYLEGNADRLVYKLESMVGNVNGLDYVSPAFSFIDLGQISEENWIRMIETLRSMGNYDYIILDLSEMVCGLLNVLRKCDLIYTIADREGFALTRLEQYEELLHSLEYDDIKERTKKYDLPVFKKLPSSLEELPYSDLAGYVKNVVASSDILGVAAR